MLDTLNSVGLSDSLLRVIDRRQTFDKLLVYGGMVSFNSRTVDKPYAGRPGLPCDQEGEIDQGLLASL